MSYARLPPPMPAAKAGKTKTLTNLHLTITSIEAAMAFHQSFLSRKIEIISLIVA